MRAIHLVWLLVLAAITGCTQAQLPPSRAAPPASAGTGSILSMRSVAAHAAQGSLRGALLTTGAPADHDDRALVEFIVRADDGATLSIVQTNDAGFRAGDRVLIIRGDHTRLARPVAPAGS